MPASSSTEHPPAGAQRLRLGRRAAFVVVAYAFLVTMVSTTLPTPLYSQYQGEFGFSQLMVTVIFASYAGGVIFALLMFGRLSDQIGRRAVLLPGVALAAISAGVFLLAQGGGMLLLGRVISGLSAGLFTGAATAALLDLAAPHRRGQATLVATVVNMGGLGLGALLAGVITQWAGSPLLAPFWFDLVILLPAAIGLWFMPEQVQRQGSVRFKVQALHVPPEVRPIFVRAGLAAFAGFSVLGLFTAVAPAFLGKVMGIENHAVVGLVVFSVFAASAAGQIALDWIPDHAALPAGCSVMIVGMAFLAWGLAASTLAPLVAGGLLAGFGQGVSFRSGLQALGARSPASRRAEVSSSFFVVAYVALAIPVIGEGLLAQLTDLRTAGILFAAAVALLCVIVLVLLRTGAREPQPAAG